MSTIAADPAIRSYFFDKGYRDLYATIVDSWQRNLRSASDFFERSPGSDGSSALFEKGLWISAGISTLIFGTAFFLVASALHIVLLGVFFALIYVAFTVLWLTERGYMAVRSFFMACPHCHEKLPLPHYLCDGCGAVHARLLPNSYGITSHTCKCGQKLPATFFLDRGRLQARCPVCAQNIAREHVESRRIFIPIIGGPSAGKSAFIFTAVRALLEDGERAIGFRGELFDKRSESAYREVTSLLDSGHTPDKTRDPLPRAFNVGLHKDGRLQYLLYLYDPAGEAYQDVDKLAAHRFHEYLSGMILIIDPFAIPAVCEQYESELARARSAIKPSDLPIEEALARLLVTLETEFELPKTATVKEPLAIVLSKVDAFDLEEVIGEEAVDRAVAMTPGSRPVSRPSARNALLRQQLIDWGEEAFVRRIDARFANVSYFSCSALGRIPDGSGAPFKGNDVLSPLRWVFDESQRSQLARVMTRRAS